MSEEERYKKYVKEHCNKCKNKNEYECEIIIYNSQGMVTTKCENYEREDETLKRKKQPINWQSW